MSDDQVIDNLSDDLSAAFDEAIEVKEEPKVEPKEEPPQEELKAEEPKEAPEEPKQELEEVEPPLHWSSADKEAFKAVPRESQKWLLDRYKSMEADATRKYQEISNFRHQKEALDQILAPHRQYFSMHGVDDVGAIRQLVAAHEFLQSNPTAAIQHLAKQYGADLNAEQPYVDPDIKALKDEIAQLKGNINSQLQAKQYEAQQSLQSQIQSFAEEKEGDNLKHPYFEEVKSYMGALIQAGAAQDLEGAYQQAIYANPSTRQKILAADREAEEKRRAAERAAKVEQAKQASFEVKGSGSAVKPANTNNSLADDLAAAWDSIG